MKRSVQIGLLAAIGLALAAGGAAWWLAARKVRETENAYVNADVVQVASQVSGPVIAVRVREGQLVKAGQPLFDIDPASFALALAQAEARLAEAEQGNREDRADVNADAAALAQAEADLGNARGALRRIHSLVQQNFFSRQAEDDAEAKVKVAEAAVAQAHAKLAGARAHAGEAAAAPGMVGATPPAVRAARAAVEQARLDLARTHVVASKDGWIASLTLVPGSPVTANTPLFALIARGSFWVDANFKETELPGIVPGQVAEVAVDMQPGRHYRGVVETIGGGTGAAFSLLPAQNATGNWVKVTQRVPVRIRLEGDAAQQPFRVGASAEVRVRIES